MNEIDDCIICKLLSGELEVSMVYQDDCCSAFMDIQPVNPGHMLVVPNRHTPYLAGLKEEEAFLKRSDVRHSRTSTCS